MNKEEILEASREENKNKDLAELEIENKAVKIASIGMIILVTVYFCMEIFVKGETNYGWYSIISLYSAILYGYKAIKIKKKLYVFNGIIWGLLTIILVTTYIKNIFMTSTII